MAEARRERKVVTVLFADLVGFTSRAEEMDPEDVAAELARYQGHVRGELERRGGTVEKFIGDAAMAIFGAPATHEDDAERAVRAAIAIQEWAVDQGIEIRIGINTGEALVTVDARPEAGETMAAGDVVNTAARLQTAAPVNGIVVGEQTFRATGAAIEYREAAPVEAKGKSQPVPVWEVVAARARFAVERVHGATLVGRAREVALLEDALARTMDERSSQLVTLVGVPGIGKSRMVLELYEAVERIAELISWRQGRCLPYGDGVTFWALGEMVKAQAGILEGEDPAEVERKLQAVTDDAWVQSHLRPLVGLVGSAEGGGDKRDEAFTAWRRFFEGLADERPLVLVFEDLHWADDNLLDFVDHLVDWATAVPLLVVCTARPELLSRRPDWGGGKPNALTVSLSSLSDHDTARLLADLLGSVLPAETQVELLARAGGNPLYAEEFARMFRDRGLVGDLPETVQGLIAARLDLLEPEQKALLQDAAVVGKRFWLGALGSLSGLQPVQLETRLHVLERKEFIRRERTSTVLDDTEYAFRHLLVRDVAYGQVPRAARAEKHLLAARWIEQLGRREDHAEMLAHHYLQALEFTAAAGGDTSAFADSAREALADAGDRAFGLNAYEAATRFFRAALDLTSAGDPARGRLLLRLGRTLPALGEPDAAVLEQAIDELLGAGDIESAVEAETELSELHWLAGDRDRAFGHLERARRLAEPLPRSAAKARAVSMASRILMLAAEYGESIPLAEEALEMARRLGLDEIRAATLNNIGTARTSLGEEEGLDQLTEAAEVARAANSPYELCRALGNLAAMYWTGGRLREAIPLVYESLRVAEEYGQRGLAHWDRGVLVQREHDLGLWDGALERANAFLAEVEAGSPHYLASQCYFVRGAIRFGRSEVASEALLRDIDRALELGRAAKDPQAMHPPLAWAAHLLHGLGDTERASKLAGEFLGAVQAGGELGYGVTAFHVLSWTLVEEGRGEEVAVALERFGDNPWARAGIAFGRDDPARAADICEEMGALTQEAYARLASARLLVSQGRRGEADEQLHRALAFYRSVGAKRYVREGEALLAVSA